jgi:hypothetical protein
MRGFALLLLVAAAVLWAGTQPTRAQTPLNFYYCSLHNVRSDVLYVSPARRVGPVSERASYGPAYAAELAAAGLVPAGSTPNCTMRATDAEIAEGRANALRDCRTCGAATRVVVAGRGGGTPTVARRTQGSGATRFEAPEESIRRQFQQNSPGTCLVDRGGGVRCTGGVQDGKPLPGFSVDPAPRHQARIESPPAGRAYICTTRVAGRCVDSPVATPTPKPRPSSLPGSGTIKPAPKPSPAPIPTPTQAPKPKPTPAPRPRLETVCATMDVYGNAQPVTITLRWPEIQVHVSGHTRLFMRHLGTGAAYTLGATRYSIPAGTYRLWANGPAVGGPFGNGNISACATYRVA